MVTITYDALNDLVHEVGEQIEKTTGIAVDLMALNPALVRILDDYGVQYEEELDPEMTPAGAAVANVKDALRVIAPIQESMRQFGHTQADDMAGAQSDLEQAVRFLTGEEEPS